MTEKPASFSQGGSIGTLQGCEAAAAAGGCRYIQGQAASCQNVCRMQETLYCWADGAKPLWQGFCNPLPADLFPGGIRAGGVMPQTPLNLIQKWCAARCRVADRRELKI